jgi:hypothetical protein
MTDDELLTTLLDGHDRTRALLLATGTPLSWAVAELVSVWREAQAQARHAYEGWRSCPGRDAYAVYLAAQDRADAAQLALSAKTVRTTAAGTAHA